LSATGVAGITIGELAAGLCPDAAGVLQSPDFTSLNGAITLTSGYDVSTWFVLQLCDAFLLCGKLSAS
jgi:hypothetical protein